MTQMPQLVAMLHSFVGLAAVLVGISSYVDPDIQFTGVEQTIHHVEIFLGVFIGAITFTGSIVAFGKLQGTISGKPLLLPARHLLNLVALRRRALARLRLRRLAGRRRRHGAAARDDADRDGDRRASGRRHRRRRHAGRRQHAEQLFGLGRGRDRLHVVERPVDRDRRARRIERRDPLLHHVPRDEPQLRRR